MPDEQPTIPPQRIKVGTIVVDGRTGQVRLEDITANEDVADVRSLVDIVGALHAWLQRCLYEHVIRHHAPALLVEDAVRKHLPEKFAEVVREEVRAALAEMRGGNGRQGGIVLARPGIPPRPPGL